MKKVTSLFIVIALFVCCKNETKQDKPLRVDSGVEEIKAESKTIDVVINAKVLVDDVFEVYYYEPGLQTFHPKDFVSSQVKGSQDFQDITFSLPENILPERIRLDFGKLKNQKEIILNSIKLVYGQKEYVFSEDEILNEFKPSKFIDFDKETMSIKTKEIDGKYDPYFYSKKVIGIVDFLLED
jgi:hypothetical protein